jgi:N-acetylmuramoyl-L-alanine amidase
MRRLLVLVASVTMFSAAVATACGPSTALVRPGDTGAEVVTVQQQLSGLGYWLGAVDGVYGPATTHAVVAFQKAAGLDRDGIAGPITRSALNTAQRLRPVSGAGRVIEVDLARQIVLVADGGRTSYVFDASTGATAGSTPRGQFSVILEINGYDYGPYGALYRPKYFYSGIAVHGYPDVPPYPASHGCVRVMNQVMDFIWASNLMPLRTAVWVY